MTFFAVDLFAGCGGMTEGIRQAGIKVVAAVEIDRNAAKTYRQNHNDVELFETDIRLLDPQNLTDLLNGNPLHLLAGCPPCQGFSSIRRKNRNSECLDSRNELILEFLRFVKELRPLVIMLENVPGLEIYSLFHSFCKELEGLGYDFDWKVVDVANYGVPQRRKRLVLVGSSIGKITVASGENKKVTVRDTIESLEVVEETTDALHKIFPQHSEKVMQRIKLTPHDGGSRRDLPDEYTLPCHNKPNVGFNDVYGRLRWDDVSSTITGGCLNPSKGRFLHPVYNRCITAREAALLQTFPRQYIFPVDIPRSEIALMIGNALPPEFCKRQTVKLKAHLHYHLQLPNS